jgi:single-strand DNA-binding protein
MSDMFTATITGTIGRDAEIRPAGSTTVTSFSVAVGTWSKQAGKDTQWVKVSMFGKRGESVAPLLTKGTRVVVGGSLSFREYTDKDGVVQKSVEINANEVIPFLKPRDGQGGVEGGHRRNDDDDNLPF